MALMETNIKLKYSGPGVESGQMDVYQASANMIAFSEFMVVAAKAAYGNQVDVKAEVAGFGRGSFYTNLVFNFLGPIAAMFSAASPEQLLKMVNESFELWKHLKGEPPKKTQHVTPQFVKVENNNGEIIQVHIQTLSLVFNEKSSDAVKQFVQDAFAKGGIDNLTIETDDDKVIATANQNDASSFHSVAPTESITDTTIEMTLVIEAVVFKDGNKWRFYDGQTSFYADIVDHNFLAKVERGERFGKGDLLRVNLKIVQNRSDTKISTERTVIKVIEHKDGPRQEEFIDLDA